MEYFVDDPHGVAGWAESLSPLHIASDASKGPFAGDMVAAIAAAPGCDVNKKTTPATGDNVRVAFPRTTPLGGALIRKSRGACSRTGTRGTSAAASVESPTPSVRVL